MLPKDDGNDENDIDTVVNIKVLGGIYTEVLTKIIFMEQ